MLSRATSDIESPALILERTTALVDYLMAVRAQLEKPARTVPTADVFWQHDLPDHPDCQVGVSADGVSWLQVGLPAAPRRLKTPVEFVAHLADPRPTRPSRGSPATRRPSRGCGPASSSGGSRTGGPGPSRPTAPTGYAGCTAPCST